MSDLINREDAMKKLERVKITHPHADISLPIDLAIRAIKELPSVSFDGEITEVVVFGDKFEKVVHCEDCVYLNRKEAYGDEWKECTHYPQHHIRLNDYCSYGERRKP